LFDRRTWAGSAACNQTRAVSPPGKARRLTNTPGATLRK
jgi:hypothetical protein